MKEISWKLLVEKYSLTENKHVLPLKRLISMYCKKRPKIDNISISYYPISKIFSPKCAKNTALLEFRLFLKISDISNETYSSLRVRLRKSEKQFIIILLENHSNDFRKFFKRGIFFHSKCAFACKEMSVKIWRRYLENF